VGLKTRLMRAIVGTRRCPRCFTLLPADGSFCRSCGSSLQKALPITGFEATLMSESAEGAFRDVPEEDAELVEAPASRCAQCSAANPAGARYCASCGKPLAQRAPGSETAPIGGFDLALPKRAHLAVLNSDGTLRKAWPLNGEGAVVGAGDGDVVLEGDAFISARHARLQRQESGWSIEDLGTVNGTYRRIKKESRLGHGDYVRIGRQLFRIARHGELFAPTPPAVPNVSATFYGSPPDAVELYLVQILSDRRLGHVLGLGGGGGWTVGRKTGELVFPNDDYLSGKHARFELRDGACWVIDLGSTNGVYVRLAGAAPLEPDDLLWIGETLVRFEVS
jgi:pSer/pThr/pTyr-binding forkhead associated (FHA) protein